MSSKALILNGIVETQVVRQKSKDKINGIQVTHEEFLNARPLRHSDSVWTKDAKGLHVKLRAKILPKTILSQVFSRILPQNRETRVLLDEQGAFIWNLCDGEHTIKDIAKNLHEQYKMLVPDAEAALDLYMVQLSKQNLIGFVLPDTVKKKSARFK